MLVPCLWEGHFRICNNAGLGEIGDSLGEFRHRNCAELSFPNTKPPHGAGIVDMKPTWGMQGAGGGKDVVFVCLLTSLISFDRKTSPRAGNHSNRED